MLVIVPELTRLRSETWQAFRCIFRAASISASISSRFDGAGALGAKRASSALGVGVEDETTSCVRAAVCGLGTT